MRRIIGRPYLTVCRCPAAGCLDGRTPRCSHPPSQELWEGVKGEDVQEVTDLCNYTDLSQPRTVSTLWAMVRTVRSARQDWITCKIVVVKNRELFETVAVKKSTQKKLSDIMLADMESDSIAFDQSACQYPHIDIDIFQKCRYIDN